MSPTWGAAGAVLFVEYAGALSRTSRAVVRSHRSRTYGPDPSGPTTPGGSHSIRCPPMLQYAAVSLAWRLAGCPDLCMERVSTQRMACTSHIERRCSACGELLGVAMPPWDRVVAALNGAGSRSCGSRCRLPLRSSEIRRPDEGKPIANGTRRRNCDRRHHRYDRPPVRRRRLDDRGSRTRTARVLCPLGRETESGYR